MQAFPGRGPRPVRLFLSLSALILVAEAGIQAVFETLLPALGGWAEAVADGVLLAGLVMPILWRTSIRPMAEGQERLALLGTALTAAGNGIFIARRDGVIEWANPAFGRLTGYGLGEVVGRHPGFLKSGAHDRAFYETMWGTILTGGTWRAETVDRRKDGSLFTVLQTITPIVDAHGIVTHFVAIHEDITLQKQAEERVRHLAHHDPLTGLPNRVLFLDRLEHALALARREGHGVAVMYLDLDRFKQVNDTLGHGAGDRLLEQTARRILSCLRESDTVGRMGGDEFTVLLQGVRCIDDAAGVAAKIVEALGRPFELGGERVEVGTSIGIAMFPCHGTDAAALVELADRAMYDCKRGGGRAWCFTAGCPRRVPG